MTNPHPCERVSRRRALQVTFCSSAVLALNLRSVGAEAPVDRAGLHFLAVGDQGTTGRDQAAVARAMRAYRESTGIRLQSLLLLGDNIYNRAAAGLDPASPHWRAVFEDVYPEGDFSCPCSAVLGNHDYSDNPGGEQAQLRYAKRPGTRWHMPAKWYRTDVGEGSETLTILALDSNEVPRHLSEPERAEQLEWLETQLSGPRGRFTLVMAHHPIYSNGKHGDTDHLVRDWAALLEQHRVHLYLAGHDHDLQHLEMAERFTSFVISGGGGARTRALSRRDRPVPFARDVHGFTHVHLVGDELRISHHTVDGAVVHRFTKRSDGGVQMDAV